MNETTTPIVLTREELDHRDQSPKETLLGLGVDPDRPIETQRDFAHLRWWRQLIEGVLRAIVIAFAIGFGVTLAAGLMWVSR